MSKKPARQTIGRKKRYQPEDHHEVVDIERNAVEAWLIDLKHWSAENKPKVKLIGLVVALLVLAFSIFVFVRALTADAHNLKFYRFLETYESAKQLDADAQNKALKDLVKNTNDMCETFFSTDSSYNACLVSALAYQQLGDEKAFARYLKQYGDHHAGSGLGAYTLFYAAYALEQSNDFEAAIKVYDQIYDTYAEVKKEDIVIYHKGRMNYLLDRREAAATLFKQLVKDYPTSQYKQDAQKYLLLIEALKAQQLSSINQKK